MKSSFSIPRLMSGGLIVSYHCTSTCRHCLYNSSPSRSKNTINSNDAFKFFSRARQLGAISMHIGGGEPMLDIPGLEKIIQAAENAGVHIEYVETNSSWYKNHEDACQILESLKIKGLSTLLISISPFHMEYIPFDRVKGVIKACQTTGIQPFLWMETFIRDLVKFDSKKPHRFEKVTQVMGEGYLESIRNRYWIHPGGRALDAFRSLTPPLTLEQVLNSSECDCARSISDTSHFHIDLYGRYIPGLCAGFGIQIEDLDGPLSNDKYPLIQILVEDGIKGLVKHASDCHGFNGENRTYSNACDLCNAVRTYLVVNEQKYEELNPMGYYRQ